MSNHDKSEIITKLLNSTYVSIKAVVPITYEVNKPEMITTGVNIKYGVMIGVTGDIKGQLVMDANEAVFSGIGEVMFGMPLEGDMLHSFSGELGNMIVGRLSTTIANQDINTDITSPTIMRGDTNLLGHKQAIKLIFTFEEIGEMNVYLLLDF